MILTGGQVIGSLTITNTGSTVLKFEEGQVGAVLPGDVVLAKKYGVIFIPPYLLFF